MLARTCTCVCVWPKRLLIVLELSRAKRSKINAVGHVEYLGRLQWVLHIIYIIYIYTTKRARAENSVWQVIRPNGPL